MRWSIRLGTHTHMKWNETSNLELFEFHSFSFIGLWRYKQSHSRSMSQRGEADWHLQLFMGSAGPTKLLTIPLATMRNLTRHVLQSSRAAKCLETLACIKTWFKMTQLAFWESSAALKMVFLAFCVLLLASNTVFWQLHLLACRNNIRMVIHAFSTSA